MKAKKISVLFYFWAVFFSMSVGVTVSEAVVGKVETNGQISFYEETTSPDTSTSDSSGEPLPDVSSEPSSSGPAASDVGEKPTGKYPNTGETMSGYPFIGTGLIILGLSLLLLRKYRKGDYS